MATQVKHRRGSSAEIDGFTPAIGELVVNTTDFSLRVGDGEKAGGHILRSGNNAINVTAANIEVIAHRGFRDAAPENTMLAFTSANARGADYLEADMQITSDGVVVLYHDSTLDSLTDGTGSVASNTITQVRAAVYDITVGTIYESGCKIPFAADFFAHCKRTSTPNYVEIKDYRTQADIGLMMSAIEDADVVDLSSISSFDFSDVVEARRLNADIEVAYIISTTNTATFKAGVDSLIALGGKVGIISNHINLLAYPEQIAYCQSLGVPLSAYTVENVEAIKDLIALGVTKIITDNPQVIV